MPKQTCRALHLNFTPKFFLGFTFFLRNMMPSLLFLPRSCWRVNPLRAHNHAYQVRFVSIHSLYSENPCRHFIYAGLPVSLILVASIPSYDQYTCIYPGLKIGHQFHGMIMIQTKFHKISASHSILLLCVKTMF